MSRRAQSTLNGSSIPKAPSKREIQALVEKRKKEEKELLEKLNIPPRDEEKYPMPEQKDIAEAGAFVYTLGCLSESYDGNLKSLVWRLYVDLKDCLKSDSTQEELFRMIRTLTDLKEYIAKSNNPLFAAPKTENPKSV